MAQPEISGMQRESVQPWEREEVFLIPKHAMAGGMILNDQKRCVRRIRWVTFPRSGHHWCVRMVQAAFPSLVYDEHHRTGNTLENNPFIDIQKTHDFAMDVPKNGEFTHIVQIRDFACCFESWKRLESFRTIKPSFAYYIRFIRKWIIGDVPYRFVLNYENLHRHRVETLTALFCHIFPSGDLVEMRRSAQNVAFVVK